MTPERTSLADLAGGARAMRAWWLLIAANFFSFAWAGWGSYGHYQIDTYQSSYVIVAISKGEVPYVDFAYYFGPLAIEIYGAIMRLTGAHLETVYALGLATIALALPLIWVLAAELGLPVILRAGSCLFFLNLFAFSTSFIRLFNWAVPYCHSSTHAVLLLMAGLICGFRWRRRRSAGLALAWGLCAAGVVLNRPDLGCVYALLSILFCSLSKPRVELSQLGAWLLGFLVPTSLIYGYFLSRVGWKVMLFENLFWRGHDPRLSGQQRTIFGGWPVDLEAIAIALALHLLIWFVVGLLGDTRATLTVPVGLLTLVLAIGGHQVLMDLPFLLVLLAVVGPKLTPQQKLVAALSAFLLARILLRCNLVSYLFYLGVVPTVLLLALAWQACWNRAQQAFVIGLVLVLSGHHAYLNLAFFAGQKVEILTPRGDLRLLPNQASLALEALLKDLGGRGVEGRSVLVLPEGGLINTLTGSRHPLYHPTTLPTTLAVYGEAAIIAQIAKAKPDFIVLQHRWSPEYGPRDFGVQYGVELVRWVKQSYDLVAGYGKPPFKTQRYDAGGVLLFQRRQISSPASAGTF